MADGLEPILRIGLHDRVRLGSFWDHLELPGSYWRLYWMQESGAALSGRDGKLRQLSPDCIYLLSPNCNLMGHCAGTPVQYYLHFELAGMAGNPEIPLHEIPISGCCKELLAEWKKCIDDGSQDAAPGILRAMALAVFALGRLSEETLQARPPDRRIEKVCALMRSTPARDWSIAELAREAGLTSNYFLRHFQAVTGVPPGRYLRRLRYDSAARMLADGTMSIDQICQEIGVKDRFHFSREFKRYFGEPPAQYRKHRRAVSGRNLQER
ncbi:MAG: helix-turn-helix transcriptional regulator [Lentisphaeria bacterium]|nr:helix-turn-helix transcriptional regulator [Lentisphaeria bacterium]